MLTFTVFLQVTVARSTWFAGHLVFFCNIKLEMCPYVLSVCILSGTDILWWSWQAGCIRWPLLQSTNHYWPPISCLSPLSGVCSNWMSFQSNPNQFLFSYCHYRFRQKLTRILTWRRPCFVPLCIWNSWLHMQQMQGYSEMLERGNNKRRWLYYKPNIKPIIVHHFNFFYNHFWKCHLSYLAKVYIHLLMRTA